MMNKKRHEKILSLLQKIAEDNEHVAHSRHAAAIVYRNEIIAFGANSKVTHPFQKRYARHEDAIMMHAETSAIKNALRRLDQDKLSRASLYVLRMKYTSSEKNEMVRAMSKPCEGCARCISQFGIRNVYYTDEYGELEML